MIDRLPRFGSIEIYEMQPGRPVVCPTLSHLDGVITEDRFLSVISLPESDTFSVAEINSGKDFHASS